MSILRPTPFGRPGTAATIVVVAVLAVIAVGPSAATSHMPSELSYAGEGSSVVGPNGGSGKFPVASTATPRAFSISGHASGLFPGHSEPLILHVTNTDPFPLVVTTLTTIVSRASASCGPSNLAAGAFRGRLSVKAHGTATKVITITMSASAPNGCRGATFPLLFRGTAVKPS